MCRLSGPTGRFGSEQSDSQRDQCCCPDERMDAFSFRHLLSSFLLGLISFGGSATGRSARGGSATGRSARAGFGTTVPITRLAGAVLDRLTDRIRTGADPKQLQHATGYVGQFGQVVVVNLSLPLDDLNVRNHHQEETERDHEDEDEQLKT